MIPASGSRVALQPRFGTVPSDADNLAIVGPFPSRIEVWDGAVVWPGSGVVRRPDGQIEIQSIWIESNLAHCGDFQSRWSKFPRLKRGTCFNLSLFWWRNYYHWHCDVLTRLWATLPRIGQDRDVKILLPPGLEPWQLRSLERLGLDFDRCVEFKGRRPWKPQHLLWSSPVAMTGDVEPGPTLGMRNAILGGDRPATTPVSSTGGSRFYLTR